MSADDVLAPGRSLSRTLNGGETHTFKIPVTAAQFLNVRIIHRGIIVGVTLADVNGKPLIEMDSVSGGHGFISLSTITESSGDCTLTVRSTEAWANAGQYEAAVHELRPASPADVARIAAERTFAQGRQLARQGTNDARKQAIQKYNEALVFWQAQQDTHWGVMSLYSIGAAYRRLGQLSEASIYFDKSLSEDLVAKLPEHDWRLKASILNDRGLNDADLGKYQDALKSVTAAGELFRAHNDQRGQASALNNLGYTHTWMGRYDDALESYNASMPLRKAEKDQAGEYNVINNIAYVRSLQGHSELALSTYLEVIEKVEANKVKLKEPDQLAAFYQNVAQAYDNLGASQNALDWYKYARQKLENPKGRTAVAVLDNTGELYAALGDTEKALTYFSDAMTLLAEDKLDAQRVFDPEKAASVRTHIGQIHLLKGDVVEAIDQFQKAVNLRQSSRTRADALINLGAAYAYQQDPQKALDYYSQAQRELESSKDRDNRIYATMLLKRSEAYKLLGNQPLARADLDEGLLIWNQLKDSRGAATALQGMALLEQQNGRLDEAVRINSMALEMIESLRTTIANTRLRTSYFATKQAYYELNIALNMNLYQRDRSQKYLTAALEASEKSRARSLMDSLNEVRSNLKQGVSEALLRSKQELEGRLNALEITRISLMNRKHTQEQASAIEKAVTDLNREIEDLEARILTSSPKYAALIRPKPLTTAQIQQQLDDNSVLLEYSLGDKRSYVWAVTPKSIEGFELPARAEIEAAAKLVTKSVTERNQQITNESPEQYRRRIAKADTDHAAAAFALSKFMLAPVAPFLGEKNLVIVTDGDLQLVSFAELPAPENPAKAVADRRQVKAGRTMATPALTTLLIDDHTIVYEPSASVLALQRHELGKRQPAPYAVAVLANPVFGKDDARVGKAMAGASGPSLSLPQPGQNGSASQESAGAVNQLRSDLARALDDVGLEQFPPLRSSSREAESIKAAAGQERTMLALDFEANRSTAMSEEVSKYRFVHFATHGVVDFERPELSGIVLSLVDEKGQPQDGYLRLHDIYNLNLPAELVVLSACQTGVGKQIKGEGLIALTRGFMYAGAQRVVATLWKVDDAATADLMAEFYKQMLIHKHPPSAALRAAQKAMSKRPARHSPYFWAGFVLQGEWK